MGEDGVAAADLPAQAAPESRSITVGALAFRISISNLPLATVGGAHAGREVHPQQIQRQVVVGRDRGAAHGGLLWADGERLHLDEVT